MAYSAALLKLLNILLVAVSVLFFLDAFTSVEIQNQTLKEFAFFGIIIWPPISLLANLILQKENKLRMGTSLFCALVMLLVLVLNPVDIIFSSSAWKTQTVLFENKEKSKVQIAFQMQDVGAHGYNRRIVRVSSFLSLFCITNPIENLNNLGPEWIRVDREVNELGLKGG